MSPPPDTDLTPSGGDETRDAVEAVLRDQAQRKQRQEKTEEPRKDTGGLLLVVGVVLTIVAVSVWTSPPGWAQPEPFPTPSPDRVEAGLRMDMWVAVQRIRDFQAERQRLPVTLWEAVQEPADTTDLRYERLSADVFRLVGSRDGIEVTFESTESATELTATARTLIGGGSGG